LTFHTEQKRFVFMQKEKKINHNRTESDFISQLQYEERFHRSSLVVLNRLLSDEVGFFHHSAEMWPTKAPRHGSPAALP